MNDLLPVGARVRVTPITVKWRDESETTEDPYNAIVVGYDLSRTKYRLDRELWPGHYSTGGHSWAFLSEVTATEEAA